LLDDDGEDYCDLRAYDHALGVAAHLNPRKRAAALVFHTMKQITKAEDRPQFGICLRIRGNCREASKPLNTKTLPGSQTSGYVDGTGAAAEFNSPGGIAIGASGSLLVRREITRLANFIKFS